MPTETVAKIIVQLGNSGQSEQAVDELYAADIVSIEARGTDGMPARMQGFGALIRTRARRT